MLTQVTEYGPLLLEWQESSYDFPTNPAEPQLRPAEAEMVKDGLGAAVHQGGLILLKGKVFTLV